VSELNECAKTSSFFNGEAKRKMKYTPATLKKLRAHAKLKCKGAYKAYKENKLTWGEYVALRRRYSQSGFSPVNDYIKIPNFCFCTGTQL